MLAIAAAIVDCCWRTCTRHQLLSLNNVVNLNSMIRANKQGVQREVYCTEKWWVSVRDCCFAVLWECELNFIVRHCCAAASERRVVAASNVKKPSGTHCLLTVDMIQRPRVGREFILKYPSHFSRNSQIRENCEGPPTLLEWATLPALIRQMGLKQTLSALHPLPFLGY